jgi:hypothetical protein
MSRAFCALAVLVLAPAPMTQSSSPLESLPFAPRHAVCYRAAAPLQIDGRSDEPSWQAAAWSEPFVDIEGDSKPQPRFRTRVKMLWDDDYLYVAADLEEPDVWGTLMARDSVIYRDNDFEVFIDPDGDTHEYYELEINALNTVWDLMLIRPYRDGGPAINGWDIAGLRSAVAIQGTLNRPGDKDDGWSVELAVPWAMLKEAAPGGRRPRAGDQWRVNFSRVEWQTDEKDGRYVKRLDAATGKPLSENNWVWSAQGAIAMHMPERWGYVQFSNHTAGRGADAFVVHADEATKWALRRLYYRQAEHLRANGKYARSLAALGASDIDLAGAPFRPVLHAADDIYVMSASASGGGTIHLRQDGRVWTSRTK